MNTWEATISAGPKLCRTCERGPSLAEARELLQQALPEIKCLNSKTGGVSGGDGVALRQPLKSKVCVTVPPPTFGARTSNFVLLRVPEAMTRAAPDGGGNEGQGFPRTAFNG
jgi:hypothetical protein